MQAKCHIARFLPMKCLPDPQNHQKVFLKSFVLGHQSLSHLVHGNWSDQPVSGQTFLVAFLFQFLQGMYQPVNCLTWSDSRKIKIKSQLSFYKSDQQIIPEETKRRYFPHLYVYIFVPFLWSLMVVLKEPHHLGHDESKFHLEAQICIPEHFNNRRNVNNNSHLKYKIKKSIIAIDLYSEELNM